MTMHAVTTNVRVWIRLGANLFCRLGRARRRPQIGKKPMQGQTGAEQRRKGKEENRDVALCDLPTGWWGDFNDDGRVDFRDYQLLQTCFGSVANGVCERVIMDSHCNVELDDLQQYTSVLSGPLVVP